MIVRPRWLPPLSLFLSIIGLGLASYLTYEHFTGSESLYCSESSTVNCLAVTTSQWSRFLGMPVAVLGLVFFLILTVLCLPPAWHRAPRSVDYLRLILVAGGLLMALYLIWAELFRIHAICLWCTGVHIVTFILLLVLAIGAIFTYEERTQS